MTQISLSTEIQFLKGVGPRVAPNLKKMKIVTAGDLLYLMPRRYEDRRNLPSISSIHPGEPSTVKGRLASFERRPISGGRVILKGTIRDRSGCIVLTWFNQPWLAKRLENYRGEIIAYGTPKLSTNNLEIASPEFELIDQEEEISEFARIMPIYPLTEGLGQITVRKIIGENLDSLVSLVEEPLPIELLKKKKLMSLQAALKEIHRPASLDGANLARRRLVFEEFLYLQLALAMRRYETLQETGISFPIELMIQGKFDTYSKRTNSTKVQRSSSRSRIKEKEVETTSDTPASNLFIEETRAKYGSEPLWDQIHRLLPFSLTGAQKRVIHEIWNDMERPQPMNRLVQGDVGSGKTAVSACAMLAAVRAGYQCAIMAPTEILAEQHATTLRELFKPIEVEVGLVTGRISVRDKRAALARIASGEISIAVGTHALIQDGVEFRELGLVVVDEQHRFGVLQRAALREKGKGIPDVLVMTATPIPRTLSLTIFGDLDLSIIDELPPGRKPIKTHWKELGKREQVYEAVRQLLKQGRQAYFVCPMVSENETMLSQAAEELHYRLSKSVYPEFKLGLLHGKMKSKEKEAVMNAFRGGEIQVLVSTTVIEVGVDVPNASIMVVEDANRFGLAQLHQLRGRVGRGDFQSFCVLLADARTDEAASRLDVMVQTTDGFKISEEDFRLRGPGDVAGTKQSGYVDFRIGDILKDGIILEEAREEAIKIVEANPSLEGKKWAIVRDRVSERRSLMAIATIS